MEDISLGMESTSEPTEAQAPYKPGDLLEIEMPGYEQPFQFTVSTRAYQLLLRQDKKTGAVYRHNFLKACSRDWERLAPLLDERSPSFDMTLQENLVGELLDAIGLAREAIVKKRSPSPSS